MYLNRVWNKSCKSVLLVKSLISLTVKFWLFLKKSQVNGISNIIYTLINNVEVRPDCNVIISRASAYDFLSDSKSEIESITAKYYEIVATSSRNTGYTYDITISDVFNRLSDTFGEPSAILRLYYFF